MGAALAIDLANLSAFLADREYCELQREKLRRLCARADDPRHTDQDILNRAVELKLCQTSILHWMLWWTWCYEPREIGGSETPFVPWPRQVEFLEWLKEREKSQTEGVCVKSRDTGVTWLCAAFALHRWLFVPGYKIMFGSRLRDLVDTLDDPDTILPKIRFMILRLPVWMWPLHFAPDKHMPHMRIVNPETGGIVTGASGDELGRGGRSTMAFLDEAAFIDRSEMVYGAAGGTTDVLISVSTPNRPSDAFARRVQRPDRHALFKMHYRDDPRKDELWVERKRRSMEPWLWRREYELDFAASVEGQLIEPRWIEASQRLWREGVQPSGFTVAGLDVGAGGSGQSVFIARSGPLVRRPISWPDANTSRTAARALEEAARIGANAVCYDAISVGSNVTNTLQQIDAEGGKLAFEVLGINVGQSPDKRRRWPDGRTSAERFLNSRAEYYWMLRDRLQKTWEYMAWRDGEADGREHPLDELLALPDDVPTLVTQLLQLTWHPTSAGKVAIESKEQMKKRGVPSPDQADALMLSLAFGGGSAQIRRTYEPVSLEREAPLALAG